MKTLLLTVAVFISACNITYAQPRYQQRHGQHRQINRYTGLPASAMIIPYRNFNYHYVNGYFYRPYGASFRIVIPPVGIFINVLPRGYRAIHYPHGFCYYYNGVYYRENNNRYQVIDAPEGVVVPGKLANAKTVIINNEQLYEANGIYYNEEISANGDISYKVVGKSGETATEKTPAELQAGETIGQLPEGSKAIVIDGKKFYVSPSNVYFEEVIQQDSISYKVVGGEAN